MLDFRDVTLEDRAWAAECMRRTGLRGSDFTFANLFNWAEAYTVKIARYNDFLLMRTGEQALHYMYPAGVGDISDAISAMRQDAKDNGMKFFMYGIPAQGVEAVEAALPDKMDIRPVRDSFDYIYSRESLATLAGKKLHGKRNHVNKFLELYPNWSYERLSSANLPDAWEMSVEWCKENKCYAHHGLQREACAVKSAFENYEALGLLGALLRVDGRVVAFTIGSEVTDDTFVVHIEKAFTDFQGAYTMINQQFVKNELSKYEYVNREDDTGDDGLRQAKESYRPVIMYERYVASEKK